MPVAAAAVLLLCCGPAVVLLLCCGPVAVLLLWSCCGSAVVLLWSCCGHVAVVVLWSCCGSAVVLLWSCCCGRAVVLLWFCCCPAVVMLWSCCGHAAGPAVPLASEQEQKGKVPQQGWSQGRHSTFSQVSWFGTGRRVLRCSSTARPILCSTSA